jgi:hypothetical protein
VGASILAVADGIAFGMVGVLSFAALGGLMTTANVAGVTVLASYGFARVYGIVRPSIYLRRTASLAGEN